jgi:hypothetical protein
MAPEYYAFAPLYPGFLSRDASVRTMSGDFKLSDAFHSVSFSDVDLEIWASRLLTDIENLLQPGQVKRAGSSCRELLNQLVEIKEQLAGAISIQMLPLRENGQPFSEDLREQIKDRLKRSLTDGYDIDAAAVCRLTFQANQNCRLTAVSENQMAGTQTVVSKAENGKEELLMVFTNAFRGKSIPFQMNLVFPELEYDIEKDENGYESSKWLRFVEPLRLTGNTGVYHLDSRINLPNPVRVCPQAPQPESHYCEIRMEENHIGWDYNLEIQSDCREQDTFYIRVEFESIDLLKKNDVQRDLFDALAEYTMNRETLWQALSENEESDSDYQKAYESLVSMAQEIPALWENWLSDKKMKKRLQQAQTVQAFSCMAERETGTEREESTEEIHFRLTPTQEGIDFLKQFGLENPYIKVLQFNPDTDQMELRFVMKNLPLFSCAQAKPTVKMIRNQNLLTGEDVTLTVREDFIYETQTVSLPLLPVSGEYTSVYKIATVSCSTITQEVMEQAVEHIYQAFNLDNYYLVVGLSVFYYYGLDMGKEQPRVVLPVTLIPSAGTVDDAGSSAPFIKALGENIYQWYQETQPSTNACGLLFDITIYEKTGKKRLLHFSNLEVDIVQ